MESIDPNNCLSNMLLEYNEKNPVYKYSWRMSKSYLITLLIILVIHPFFEKNKETIMEPKMLKGIEKKSKQIEKLVNSIPASFFDTWLKGKNRTQLTKFLNGQLRRKKGSLDLNHLNQAQFQLVSWLPHPF